MSRRTWKTRTYVTSWLPGTLAVALMLLPTIATLSAPAQTRLSPEFDLHHTDLTVLASAERRADFSCQVTPDKPALGFDLRFHSDYRVTVPVKVLAEVGGWLETVIRVTPAAGSEESVYLVRRYSIPEFQQGIKGSGEMFGGFDLGLGRYLVDWMMRDRRGRVCSSHWELEAKLSAGEQSLPLALDANVVAERLGDPIVKEPPVKQAETRSLYVKILLNLSPLESQESILRPERVATLFSILRSITHLPGIDCFSLVAFNMREQRIVDRQDYLEKIDYVQLNRALQSRMAGTLDYHVLQDRHGETHFVTSLLTDQLGTAAASADAIIILGPKITLDEKIPLEPLKKAGAAPCPIFYLNYNPLPFDNPWRDTLGSALKAYHGVVQYDIAQPYDWGRAVREILSRIDKPAAREGLLAPP